MGKHLIDDRTADRLLSGLVAPEDVPALYRQVVRMVRVAQAPASSSELARERTVVPIVSAAVTDPVRVSPTPGPRRRTKMIPKLATFRAVAITAAAVLGAGAAAAAATGSLPSQTSNASPHASGLLTAGSNVTSTTAAKDHGSGKGKAKSGNPLNLPTTGPANFHAVPGLCRAFIANNSTTSSLGAAPTTSTPPEDSSTAFTALRKDAGATSGTEATIAATITWCNSYLSKYSPGHSGSADDGTAPENENAPSGKPASPGNSGAHSSGAAGAGGTDVTDSSSHGDSSAGNSNANRS